MEEFIHTTSLKRKFKKPNVKQVNDFRPVALMSVLAKCMERMLCRQLVASVTDRMNSPLQFAYRARRCVEDVCLVLVNLIGIHLDKVWIICVCAVHVFSSAFNIIRLHLLIKTLRNVNTNNTLVVWIMQFLYNSLKRVSLGGALSDELIVNTGTPQGCILSPILFSIYTNEVVSTCTLLILVKFADDVTLFARLQDKNSLAEYLLQIDLLTLWFKESFLVLNVSKENKQTKTCV